MNFNVFEVPCKACRFDSDFWKLVEEKDPRLPEACGCYIFAIRHGENFKPWYVGLTENNTFKGRFSRHRERLGRLSDKPGELRIFLIAAMANKDSFRKPGKKKLGKKPRRSPSIHHLESILIGMALQRNSEIFNVLVARRLKKMTVPGVTPRKGRLSQDAKDLKKVLGIS